MNNRTKGNNTLREKIKDFLKKKTSGEEFHINNIVSWLSRLNKNYNLTPARVTNLLKEEENIVKFVKSGVWMKI